MSFDVLTFDVRRTDSRVSGAQFMPCWPSPLALVRTSLARQFHFPRSSYGEDSAMRDWLEERGARVEHLPKTLYHAHYRHNKPEFGGAYYRHPGVTL